MNQNKFKFGDKVRAQHFGPNEYFVVSKIEFKGPTFVYFESPVSNHFWEEGSLELRREPQKKKLYAYRRNIMFGIEFFIFDTDTAEVVPTSLHHLIGKRVPEFDIEYPEAK